MDAIGLKAIYFEAATEHALGADSPVSSLYS